MDDRLNRLRQTLKENADETIRLGTQRFSKESITAYGMRTQTINKISRHYFSEIKHLPKEDIWSYCEALWRSGLFEEGMIAANWSYDLRSHYERDDLFVFEKWLDQYVSNWATCDTFCNHTVGALVEAFPDSLSRLKQWTRSDNRWMRRGAAVSLIIPARKGLFLPDILEIATELLLDTDDLVQKGYGWMLKAGSQADQMAIFNFVMQHKEKMPRTALRYAIEKMPAELRAEAMKKINPIAGRKQKI